MIVAMKAAKVKTKTVLDTPSRQYVIECYKAASRFFTDKELFIQTRMHEMWKEESHFAYENAHAARTTNNDYRRLASIAWHAKDEETKAYWEFQRRPHLAIQPHMRDGIIECFKANPNKSYQQVESDIKLVL
ncbi:hypothetical protein IV203_006452 [Nitzschia inconspicua]|uniref:Uncharacterized protein n=1 Tax=Nitzschia inconspicua TaxID=303405 RepID=A0A9K3PA40_9STRA|nr:hypothetical protein IV203_006452 [Nitzschia inconspicua]